MAFDYIKHNTESQNNIYLNQTGTKNYLAVCNISYFEENLDHKNKDEYFYITANSVEEAADYLKAQLPERLKKASLSSPDNFYYKKNPELSIIREIYVLTCFETEFVD